MIPVPFPSDNSVSIGLTYGKAMIERNLCATCMVEAFEWKRRRETMDAKHKMLIVDSDQEFCKVMKKFFEESGCKVAIAEDGVEALDYLSLYAFDVIVSEVRMPKVGGIELMQEIKQREIDTPVIFITSWGEVESYMDLMNMGAFDYFNKPIDRLEILRVAARAVHAGGGRECQSRGRNP